MPTVTGQNVFIASDSVNFRTGEVTKANISYNSGSDKLFFSGDMVFQDPTASITGRLEVSHIEVTGAHNPWAGTDSQYAAIYLSDMDRGILGNMGGDYARPLITNGANKITIGSNGTSAIRDINIQPGNGAGSAMSNFNVFSSGVKRMTITRSGTMGFGGGQADNPYQAFVFDADGGRMDLLDGSLKIRYTPNNDAITITASVGGEGRILAYDGDTSTPHPLKIAGDYVRFSTSGAGSHEVMRITADGKVGIGTDDPETKLEIATTMSSSPTTQLYLDVDGSNSVGGGGELIFSTSASAGAKDAFNAIVRGQRSSLNDGSSDLTFLTTHVPTSSTAAARMTIKDDGKVGIGTISPAMDLDISGNLGSIRAISTGGGANLYLNSASSNLTRIRWNSAAGSFAIRDDSNSSDRVTIDSDGNVGIGVADASQKLEVATNTDVSAQIGRAQVGYMGFGDFAGFSHIDSASTSNYALLQSSAGSTYLNKAAGQQIYFRNGNAGIGGFNNYDDFYVDTNTLYVDASQNTVGVGTSTHHASSKLTIQADNTNDIITGLVINSNQSTLGTAGKGVGIVMGQSNGVYSSKIANVWTNNNPSYLQTNIAFYTMHDSYLPGSETEKMRLTSQGYLGIGTGSPRGKLDVVGNTDDDTDFLTIHDIDPSAGSHRPSIRFRSDSAQIGQIVSLDNGMRFSVGTSETSHLEIRESTKNVGVGTGDPSYRLTVNAGNTNEIARFHSEDNDALISISDNTDVVYIGHDASLDVMSLGFNSSMGVSSNVNITTGGNLGIGTIPPSYAKLDIMSPKNANIILTRSSTDGQLLHNFWVDSSDHANFTMYANGETANVKIQSNSTSYFNGGNVGIGSAIPSRLLTLENNSSDVTDNSQLRINNIGAGDAYIYLYAGSDWSLGIDNSDADKFKICTSNDVSDGNSAITVTRSSTVGIGTDTVNEKLHVNGKTVLGGRGQDGGAYIAYATFSETQGGASTILGNAVYAGTGSNTYRKTYNDAGNFIRMTYNKGISFHTNVTGNAGSTEYSIDNHEQMRITTGGLVGIGTDSPDSNLEVRKVANDATIEVTTDGAGAWFFTNSTNQSYQGYKVGHNWFMGQYASNDFVIKNGLQSDGTAVVSIADSTNNVGIGLADPDTKLEVAGVIKSSSTSRVQADTYNNSANSANIIYRSSSKTIVGNNANALVIEDGGDVGIGTDSPDHALDVYGDGKDIYLRSDDNHVIRLISVSSDVDEGLFSVYHDGTEEVRLRGAGPSWIKGGEVGIGTNDPDGTLHIETAASSQTASTQADELIVENSTHGGISILTPDASRAHLYFNQGAFLRWQNSLFTIDTSNSAHHLALKAGGGNVGIGTDSPSTKLHVHGGAVANGEGEIRNDSRINRNYKVVLGSTTKYIGTVEMAGNGDAAGFHVRIYDGHSRVWREINVIVQNDSGTNNVKVIVEGGGNDANINIEFAYVNRSGAAQKTDFYLVPTSKAYYQIVYIDGLIKTDTGHSSTSSTNINLDTAVGIYKAATDDSSRVGIGTTNPSNLLSILSTANNDGFRLDYPATSNTLYPFYIGKADDSKYVRINANGVALKNNGAESVIKTEGSNNDLNIIGQRNLIFTSNESSERMRITSDGDVGIGTDTPSEALDIVGFLQMANTRSNSTQKISRMLVPEYNNSHGSFLAFMGTANETSNFVSYGGGTSSADAATVLAFYTASAVNTTVGTERMRITNAGRVGIGTDSPGYELEVNGSIVGSSKSFLIDHPTQTGKKLMHACIEGPENGVYFRGRSQETGIQAPEYWSGLVDIDSMTVDVTPIGPNQSIYVDRVDDNGDICVGSNTDEPLNYFYVVYGERKDIDKLEIVKDTPTSTSEKNIVP